MHAILFDNHFCWRQLDLWGQLRYGVKPVADPGLWQVELSSQGCLG